MKSRRADKKEEDDKKGPGKVVLAWLPVLVGIAGLVLGILSYRDKVRAEELARLDKLRAEELARREKMRNKEEAMRAQLQECKEIARDALTALSGPVVLFSERANPVVLDKAARQVEAAYLKCKSFSPEVHTAKAIVAKKQGNSKVASSHVEDALRLDSSHPNALIMRGILEQEDGHLDQAKADFEKARLSADSRRATLEHAVATLNLATVLIAQNNTNAAEPLLKETERHPATQALAYNALGKINIKHEDMEAAINNFEKALTADPDYAKALYNKACALLASGRVSEAKSYQKRLNARLKEMNEAEQVCSIEEIDIEGGAPKSGFWSTSSNY